MKSNTPSPRSELELQLANMWAELLELEIGVEQDVFALGADSLTVTQMISRLQERFGVTFSFEDIFDAPRFRLWPRASNRQEGYPLPFTDLEDLPQTAAAPRCRSSNKESMSLARSIRRDTITM